MKKFYFFLGVLLLGFVNVQAEEIYVKKIYIVDISDVITSATTEIIKEVINEKPDIIILRLNTPGGSLDSTLEIIQIIDNSEIPFIGYVSPKGAHAWSAGTFILLSTHIAAMAPHSIIGSCQPVYIGADRSAPVNESKILNAVIAVMEERMKMHDRNFTFAKKFIVENLNLNAEDAKKFDVIEIVAVDEQDLIKQINGMNITLDKKKTIIIKNAEILRYDPSIKAKLMSILSHPLIASILLIIGIYALIFGFSNPGMGAEILGAFFILLGLIGLGFDVNLVGIALLILGIALIIYELISHTFGIMGGLGIISIIAGIIFIGPLSSPEFYVSQDFFNILLYSIIVPSLIFACFLIFAVTKIFRSMQKKPVIGGDMIGEIAESVDNFENNSGFVIYKGEYWKARNLKDEKILKGDKVRIVGKYEHILDVEKI